ncbi:YkuS family protein [Clostridium sp. CS001]|uniref:YkuS family protein n=1 Tax=Clostridium sp. CS001 TaxID=2880648 RepID=UPI001CF23780|nr:YkuS family protein [Clostridium sp. CS001]MCB2291226.1 YkuS family protein [Clostridium sp. CS001]
MKKIAIQKGLTPIKDYLSQEGYTVKEFSNRKKNAGNFLNKYDSVVVTGENQNIMGVENTISSTTIIDATGMTGEEVKNQIERASK